MKKLTIFLLCLFISLFAAESASPQMMLWTYLRDDLKFRIGENTPSMTDALYDSCICWAANAMRTHGLARYIEVSYKALAANTNHLKILAQIHPLFIQSLTTIPDVGAYSNLYERGMPEIGIKDVGHGKLATDAPLSFFFQYFNQDTAWIYVYPSKSDADSLVYSYYEAYDNNVNNLIYINGAYKEALLSYAAMWVWLRLENYQEAAQAYNIYQREINLRRQERVNWIPDVSIAPQLIE